MKLAHKVLNYAVEMQKEDNDSVFLVVGREGKGKSTLTLHCLEYLGIKTLKGTMAMDGAHFKKNIMACDYEAISVLDEAGEALFSRDAMKKTTKDLVKIFMQIRAKRLITFFLLPNIEYIDKYFRFHRMHGLFNVYEKGKFNFWDPETVRTFWTSKGIRIPIAYSKSDCFSPYTGPLKAEYDEMKAKLINSLGNDTQEINKKDLIIALHKLGNSVKDISKITKVTDVYIYRIIKQIKQTD